MAHTITWQRGDGKTLYQPANGDDRMWISKSLAGTLSEPTQWSPDGRGYSPVAEAVTGQATVQLDPKLYRFKWWAQLVARSEEKRRAKATVTEVHEVKGS